MESVVIIVYQTWHYALFCRSLRQQTNSNADENGEYQQMLARLFHRSETFQRFLRTSIKPGNPLELESTSLFLSCGWIAAAAAQKRWLLIVPEIEQRMKARSYFQFWGAPALVLSDLPVDSTKFDTIPYRNSLVRQAETLRNWYSGNHQILIASAEALAASVPIQETIDDSHRIITVGKEYFHQHWRELFLSYGYQETPQVREPGDFAVRGGIIDIFPVDNPHPARFDFLGDTLEEIRLFDAGSQMGIKQISSLTIPCLYPTPWTPQYRGHLKKILRQFPDNSMGPLKEALAAGQYHSIWPLFGATIGTTASFSRLLDDQTVTVFFRPDTVSRNAQILAEEKLNMLDEGNFGPAAFIKLLKSQHPQPHNVIERLQQGRTLSVVPQAHKKNSFRLPGKPYSEFIPSSDSHIPNSLWSKLPGWRTSVLSSTSTSGLAEIQTQLRRHELTYVSSLPDDAAELNGIFLHPPMEMPALAVYAHELSTFFYFPPPPPPQETSKNRKKTFAKDAEVTPIASMFDLTPGDHVVHLDFGIGRYLELARLTTSAGVGDFLKITYADDDKLFVPVDKLHLLHKYIGASEKPILNRLQSGSWATIKHRLRSRVQVLARDLLKIQAKRQSLTGTAFPPDQPEQGAFERRFPHKETFDQAQAIKSFKQDLEENTPMDRLICGDVGYGKTEVALRAAFKVVNNGQQVAVLAPTTLLVQQHFTTFCERFRGFPYHVAMLSRFRTPNEQKKAIALARRGEVDILIGTHRLLSRDVSFLDLGLVIIDEEQRFGVRQKERLKSLRTMVDVLTLSATPIPRTLHMALSGLRDISVIDTPPENKQRVITQVGVYDEKLEQRAITRELSRGGQVFYVFNRVAGISAIGREVSRRYPHARVVVAHGQLPEKELEHLMGDFIAGKTDILVTTSIIESGLDLPNVNTLIIRDAYRFGLADLYQLRGRIGRGQNQAFAYLFYPPSMPLTEKARARLEAIESFTELGAGFQLAMRDMEIRGAGNLLGDEQHGLIMSVGIPLYSQLLEEELLKLKGLPTRTSHNLTIDLDLQAFIPREYINAENLRLKFYKRIAQACTAKQLQSLAQELLDRFGPLPTVTRQLLALAGIRQQAENLSVLAIARTENTLQVRFTAKPKWAMKLDLFKAGWSTGPTNPFSLKTLVSKTNATTLLAETRQRLEQLAVLVDSVS